MCDNKCIISLTKNNMYEVKLSNNKYVVVDPEGEVVQEYYGLTMAKQKAEELNSKEVTE